VMTATMESAKEDFEIDVNAIYTMACLAREWLVAHESGTETLRILKEAKEELSSMMKEKKKEKNEDGNENLHSSPYHEKVQEKIKSILPSDDMLNCLMKRGKYENFASAADAERVDEACEKLRRIVEELESIAEEMEETFESFTSAFENGGKEIEKEEEDKEEKVVAVEGKNSPRDKEKESEEGQSRRGRDREPRARRRSRSRSRGRDRRRGRDARDERKSDGEDDDAVVLAKRLSFLETTMEKEENKDEEVSPSLPTPKAHWMHNVPDAALSTRFSLSSDDTGAENKRSFEQWLFLCESALEGVRKELRVKQVVAEKALDSLRRFSSTASSRTKNTSGGGDDSNNNNNSSKREENDDDDNNDAGAVVLLFDLLMDAWDVQAYVDDDAFYALSGDA